MGATVKSVAAIVSEDPHAYFLARVCDFVVDDDLLPRICFPTVLLLFCCVVVVVAAALLILSCFFFRALLGTELGRTDPRNWTEKAQQL